MHMGYRQSGLLIGCKFIREREREMSSFEIFNSFVFFSHRKETKINLFYYLFNFVFVVSIPFRMIYF